MERGDNSTLTVTTSTKQIRRVVCSRSKIENSVCGILFIRYGAFIREWAFIKSFTVIVIKIEHNRARIALGVANFS